VKNSGFIISSSFHFITDYLFFVNMFVILFLLAGGGPPAEGKPQ